MGWDVFRISSCGTIFSQCRLSTDIGETGWGRAAYKTRASAYNYWGVSSLFIPLLETREPAPYLTFGGNSFIIDAVVFLRGEGF